MKAEVPQRGITYNTGQQEKQICRRPEVVLSRGEELPKAGSITGVKS